MNPSCETCRFFHALSSACRNRPPTAFLVPGRDGQPAIMGGWPPVRPEQWCGKHEPRLELV